MAYRKINQVVRADRTSVFLIRFDLTGAGVTGRSRVSRAVLKFFVWDPHDKAQTRVDIQVIRTAWQEATATWRRPAAGQRWQGSESFKPAADCLPTSASVTVRPDTEKDIAKPPVEYQVDVTSLYRLWFPGNHPNYGLALVPVADQKVDNGRQSRFQMYASEHEQVSYTPTLVLYLAGE